MLAIGFEDGTIRIRDTLEYSVISNTGHKISFNLKNSIASPVIRIDWSKQDIYLQAEDSQSHYRLYKVTEEELRSIKRKDLLQDKIIWMTQTCLSNWNVVLILV